MVFDSPPIPRMPLASASWIRPATVPAIRPVTGPDLIATYTTDDQHQVDRRARSKRVARPASSARRGRRRSPPIAAALLTAAPSDHSARRGRRAHDQHFLQPREIHGRPHGDLVILARAAGPRDRSCRSRTLSDRCRRCPRSRPGRRSSRPPCRARSCICSMPLAAPTTTPCTRVRSISAPAAALRSISSCTFEARRLGRITRPTTPAGEITAMSVARPSDEPLSMVTVWKFGTGRSGDHFRGGRYRAARARAARAAAAGCRCAAPRRVPAAGESAASAIPA